MRTKEERHDALEDDIDEAYSAMYEKIDSENRDLWELQFGFLFISKHPYKSDGPRIHAETLERLKN